MPDIDLDIATNDREEVIQYVYKKYGERFAAMVCNVVTYRARSASREVAKALGFRLETIDRMAKSIDQYHVDPRGIPTSAQHPAYHHTDRASEHGWEEPRAMPDTVGCEVTAGGVGWTVAVGDEVAATLPPAFVAVTRTTSVPPTSALRTV